MFKVSVILVSMALTSMAHADSGLAPASASVVVTSGWSGPMIQILLDDDDGTFVPMTEQAAAQAKSMVGKGKFTCQVKTSNFAAGSGEGKGQHQVFAIDNCAR